MDCTAVYTSDSRELEPLNGYAGKGTLRKFLMLDCKIVVEMHCSTALVTPKWVSTQRPPTNLTDRFPVTGDLN